MRSGHFREFKNGWVLGDFWPSWVRTKEVEVAIKRHKQGEDYPRHYQKTATEFNLVIEGAVRIGKATFFKDDYFIIEAFESIKPVFLKDTIILCAKSPSIPNDRILDE